MNALQASVAVPCGLFIVAVLTACLDVSALNELVPFRAKSTVLAQVASANVVKTITLSISAILRWR